MLMAQVCYRKLKIDRSIMDDIWRRHRAPDKAYDLPPILIVACASKSDENEIV